MSDFQTPEWICNVMSFMVPDTVHTILEPTPGDGNLVHALKIYKIKPPFEICAPTNFWTVQDRFDAVVMNPPFTPMETGYKILYKVMEMADVVIALMPWLTLINSETRTYFIKSWGLKSVTHLPRSAYPGARVQTCILDMRKGFEGSTSMFFL